MRYLIRIDPWTAIDSLLLLPGTNIEIILLHCYISRPKQNDCHFADGIFKCIFLKQNVGASIIISLKFVSEVPNDGEPTLVLVTSPCLNQ